MANDLCVVAMYGDLRLAVTHEGQAGNAALAQATLMQVLEQWPSMTADAIDKDLFDDPDPDLDEAEPDPPGDAA